MAVLPNPGGYLARACGRGHSTTYPYDDNPKEKALGKTGGFLLSSWKLRGRYQVANLHRRDHRYCAGGVRRSRLIRGSGWIAAVTEVAGFPQTEKSCAPGRR